MMLTSKKYRISCLSGFLGLVLIIVMTATNVKPALANTTNDNGASFDGNYSGTDTVIISQNDLGTLSGPATETVTISGQQLTGTVDIQASMTISTVDGGVKLNHSYHLVLNGQVNASGSISGSITGNGSITSVGINSTVSTTGSFTGSVSGAKLVLQSAITFTTKGDSGSSSMQFNLNKLGSDCIPTIHNLEALKPGDLLSPSATYASPDGKETTILSEAWYINKKETNSAVWDGSETTVELQYTCSNNSAHAQTIVIPAYVEPTFTATAEVTITPTVLEPAANLTTPEAGQETPASPANDQTPVSNATSTMALLGGIFLSGTGLAGIVLTILGIKDAVSINKAATVTPASGSTLSPVALPPTVSSVQMYPPQNIVQPKRLSPEQGAKLKADNYDRQIQVDQLHDRYTAIEQAKTRLQVNYKKNCIRFILKKAIQTTKVITDGEDNFNPLNMIQDSRMDKLFQMHDTSKDPEIIINAHDKILDMIAEQEVLKREILKLRYKIAEVNQTLVEEGL
jgi:hypothetical protein